MWIRCYSVKFLIYPIETDMVMGYVCVSLLCTIIMVHKGMSSSYRLVDCIGF